MKGDHLYAILFLLLSRVIIMGAADKTQNSNVVRYPKVNISYLAIDDHCNVTALGYTSFTHRFFDSSAISPGGKFIAVLAHRLPEKQSSIGKYADVLVCNLSKDGINIPTTRVASTTAWDAQVGAHVQWGLEDYTLFYNAMVPVVPASTINHFEKALDTPRGVVHNLISGEKRLLNCPVYHVTLDGRFAITPNLSKIAFTQYGYGVRSTSAEINSNAPADDGFYITDVSTGKCRLLISLRDLALAGHLDVTATPTYGFHAKWSSDGEKLLLVVRTLEADDGISQPSGFGLGLGSLFRGRIRRQHAFVVNKDGTNPTLLMSWSSKPVMRYDEHLSTADLNWIRNHGTSPRSSSPDMIIRWFDGNHPNWIPGSHRVSMNLALRQMSLAARRSQRGVQREPWKVCICDIERHLAAQSEQRRTGTMKPRQSSAPTSMAGSLCEFQCVYPLGSGHPNFFPGGRFFVTDAYVKERQWFPTLKLPPHFVPIRLVDTVLQKEVQLLQVQIERTNPNRGASVGTLSAWKQKQIGSRKEINAWRCDPHPAFSRDFTMIAMNGRVTGGDRQVFVAHLGKNISSFFI